MSASRSGWRWPTVVSTSTLFDVNAESVALVNDGTLPFDEPGAHEVLRQVLDAGRLRATTDPTSVRETPRTSWS